VPREKSESVKIAKGGGILNLSHALLLILLLLTFGIAIAFYQSESRSESIRFDNEVGTIKNALDNRIALYLSVLNGGRGLVEAGGDPSAGRFAAYVRGLDIQKNYPGLRRFGLIERVRSKDVEGFVERMRVSGRPDFKIFPPGGTTDHAVLVYAEPADAATENVIGFDMTTDAARAALLDQARDSGNAVASGKLSPIIPTSDNSPQTVVVVLPIYSEAEPPDTLSGKRDALEAFIYVAFRPETLLEEVTSNLPRDRIAVRLTDLSGADSVVLAETERTEGVPAIVPTEKYRRAVTFDLGGRTWQADFESLPAFGATSRVQWTIIVLITGLCFSFVVFTLISREFAARTRLQQAAERLEEAHAEREVSFQNEKTARLAAERANASKDEFLALVSHELKTPLNTIAGWIRILRANELSGETRTTALEKIEKNIRVHSDIVEQLIQYAEVMAHNNEYSGQEVDMSGVFQASLAEMLPRAAEKEIAVTPSNTLNGEIVEGSQVHLKTAFDCLFSNAIKFTTSGGHINLKLFKEGDNVRLVVSDDGAGIDAEFLPRVFEQYSQAAGSSTRGYGGLGLGLAVTFQIIRRHNGTLTAASKGKDKGSTFEIVLPIKGNGTGQ
jgi:signal transduction histidine kinase